MTRPRAGLPFLVLMLALGLTACGSADSTSGATSPTAESSTQTTAAPAASSAQRPQGKLALRKIGSFDTPVYVAGAPGFPRLLFVVEQPGKVVVLKNGKPLAKPFLDISG